MTANKSLQYGWVVVGAAFIITFITCGVNFSYGVFFLPIVNEFGWSRGLASAVMLVAGLAYAVTLPFTGILADRYGYKWVLAVSAGFLSLGLILSSQIQELWQLYVFTGLLVGLSISASFAIPVALVALWFTRRQGLALGVATLGISLGTATIPLLISYLITSAGWRMTLLMAGMAVAVLCIPATLLMRSPPRNMPSAAAGNKESSAGQQAEPSDLDTGLTVSQALRTGQFWMLFIMFLLFLSSLGLVMLHLVPYAVDSGIDPVRAAVLLTLIGIFGIAGRLSSGVLSDKIGIKPIMLFCTVLLGLNIAFIALCSEPWAFYVFAAIYGIAYSGFVTQMVRITRKVFGGIALGAVFGALMVSDGIGFGVGPWVAGNIYDATGSYQASFLAASAGLAVAAILVIAVRPAIKNI
ncbi:MAG: MFS transporter [Chloroflexi bacterium]|nr:MFS transporter [Chloroflexota bacterium]